MATDTLISIPNETQEYVDRRLLRDLQDELVYAKFLGERDVPLHSGDTTSMRRFEDLEIPAASLTEGVTPAGTNMVVTKLTAQLKEEGAYADHSDLIELEGLDDYVREASKKMGRNAGRTIDTRTRDILLAGTSVQYSNTATARGEVKDILSFDDIGKAVASLEDIGVGKLADGYYIGIIDAQTKYDLMRDERFVKTTQYAGGMKIIKNEIGEMNGVRFVLTTNKKVLAGAGAFISGTSGPKFDVHQTLIFGEEFASKVSLANGKGKPKIIIKKVGSNGADQLNQRGSVGWKVLGYTAKILNQLNGVRIEHTAS